jgi:hypothetical protein
VQNCGGFVQQPLGDHAVDRGHESSYRSHPSVLWLKDRVKVEVREESGEFN